MGNESSRGAKAASQQPAEQPRGLLQSKYRLGAAIGSGSFGEVFEVKPLSNATATGAVKITKRDGDQQDFWSDVAVFYREVAILQSLEHHNVVKYWDSFEDEASLYLVTELCAGGQVFEQIASLKRFHETDAAPIVMQMLLATNFIHGACIMHRDIKAENFMFSDPVPSPDSIVKMIDFGMSSTFKRGDMFHEVCGSRFYIAPEMLKQAYDYRIDMWAIGVTVYLLCCGQYPFKITGKKQLGDLCRPLKWRQKVVLSPETKDFVQCILKVDPDERLTAKSALAHPFIGYVEDESLKNQRRHSEVSAGSQASLNSNLGESVRQACGAIRATRDGAAFTTYERVKRPQATAKELAQRTAKFVQKAQRSMAKERPKSQAPASSARIVVEAGGVSGLVASSGAAASCPRSVMHQRSASQGKDVGQNSRLVTADELGNWDRQSSLGSDGWDRSEIGSYGRRVSKGSEESSCGRQISQEPEGSSWDGQVTKNSFSTTTKTTCSQSMGRTGSSSDAQKPSTEKGSLLSRLAPISTARRRSSKILPIPEMHQDSLSAGKLEPLVLSPVLPALPGG